MAVMARSEYERVVCRRRGELHVTRHTLVGVYHRMNFDAAFLLSGLGMASDTLDNCIGEQRDGRGIDDAQPFHPFFSTATSAVR